MGFKKGTDNNMDSFLVPSSLIETEKQPFIFTELRWCKFNESWTFYWQKQPSGGVL